MQWWEEADGSNVVQYYGAEEKVVPPTQMKVDEGFNNRWETGVWATIEVGGSSLNG